MVAPFSIDNDLPECKSLKSAAQKPDHRNTTVSSKDHKSNSSRVGSSVYTNHKETLNQIMKKIKREKEQVVMKGPDAGRGQPVDAGNTTDDETNIVSFLMKENFELKNKMLLRQTGQGAPETR